MYLIISDIHGNLSALNAVLRDAENRFKISGIFLLGDLINYGMRSNEVVKIIKEHQKDILVQLWGNHEQAILLQEYSRFSSERGRQAAQYTAGKLEKDVKEYLNSSFSQEGYKEIRINGYHIFAVHGSKLDCFWKEISIEMSDSQYEQYDIVLSGHSHHQHSFEKYYECKNKEFRNKHKTVFINPGSVGQPRNHNKCAQYAVLSLNPFEVFLCSVSYDVELEQKLFQGEVDGFYKERLGKGI